MRMQQPAHLAESADPAQLIGLALARVLSGAWRTTVPQLEIDAAELAALAPLLIGSGAGGLAWRRIERGPLASTPAGQQLRATCEMNTLWGAARERKLADLFTTLRAAGVEPLLIKGWASARNYAQRGARPPGDIDLCIHPAQSARAAAALAAPGRAAKLQDIDLRDRFPRLYDQDMDALFAGSQLVPLGGTQVRVAGPEDHLRILCLHMLRHGAWRPLWLSDIAAALETRPPDFDWDRCLGHDARRADWVACAIGLAHQLLGVPVAATPVAARAGQLPRWLAPKVLELWRTPCFAEHGPHELMLVSLQHPQRALAAMRYRWPNPIAASMVNCGALTDLPPTHWQLILYIGSILHFMRRLPCLLHASHLRRPPRNGLD